MASAMDRQQEEDDDDNPTVLKEGKDQNHGQGYDNDGIGVTTVDGNDIEKNVKNDVNKGDKKGVNDEHNDDKFCNWIYHQLLEEAPQLSGGKQQPSKPSRPQPSHLPKRDEVDDVCDKSNNAENNDSSSMDDMKGTKQLNGQGDHDSGGGNDEDNGKNQDEQEQEDNDDEDDDDDDDDDDDCYYEYNYEPIMKLASICITKWRQRYRGNIPLWNRVFKKDRVIKEVIESLPIIKAVEEWFINYHQNNNNKEAYQKVTILDLCSGKGYMSMLLSEYLTLLQYQNYVEKFILIDKAWPLCHSVPKSHHISWEHIYGDTDLSKPNAIDYYQTWPIPLVTSKQDLKQSSTIRKLKERYSSLSSDDDNSKTRNDEKKADGGMGGETPSQKTTTTTATALDSSKKGTTSSAAPILILAVHLCGTLSIQAIKLFHQLDNAKLLLLKPCCLPGLWHIKNTQQFRLGEYTFPAKEVCASGKWLSRLATSSRGGTNKVGSRWKGPPRWHLQDRFATWCHHLNQGIGSYYCLPTADGSVIGTVPTINTRAGSADTYVSATPTTSSSTVSTSTDADTTNMNTNATDAVNAEVNSDRRTENMDTVDNDMLNDDKNVVDSTSNNKVAAVNNNNAATTTNNNDNYSNSGHGKTNSNVRCEMFFVPVQNKGGYQNKFLCAEKQPITTCMWENVVIQQQQQQEQRYKEAERKRKEKEKKGTTRT